jgi:multisubunit Na+/H+ antiporter MnhC subunit
MNIADLTIIVIHLGAIIFLLSMIYKELKKNKI